MLLPNKIIYGISDYFIKNNDNPEILIIHPATFRVVTEYLVRHFEYYKLPNKEAPELLGLKVIKTIHIHKGQFKII